MVIRMSVNRQPLPPYVLNSLSAHQASLLQTYTQIHSPAYLPAELVTELKQQQSLATLGLALLPLAAHFAVTPVSNFNVGAVAFDSEGNAYLGANFEFADTHIGQTLHAEQSAIANAWQRGAKDLALLVINYPPCGHCRQFINEVNLSKDFCIQLPNRTAQPLSYYLPEAFGPADLGVGERILGQPSKQPQTVCDDKLYQAALFACVNAHAPYSGNCCGIALQYSDGEVVSGRYGENAAFNPSLPPLQMALNSRRLQGKDWQAVTRAIMLESTTTLCQRTQATQLLENLGVTLKYDTISLTFPL